MLLKMEKMRFKESQTDRMKDSKIERITSSEKGRTSTENNDVSTSFRKKEILQK